MPGKHFDERLPVAPSMDAAAASVNAPREEVTVGPRLLHITAIAVVIGIAGGFVAQALMRLIGLITNLVFFHRISLELVPPADAHIGGWMILAPVAGALVIGVMA